MIAVWTSQTKPTHSSEWINPIVKSQEYKQHEYVNLWPRKSHSPEMSILKARIWFTTLTRFITGMSMHRHSFISLISTEFTTTMNDQTFKREGCVKTTTRTIPHYVKMSEKRNDDDHLDSIRCGSWKGKQGLSAVGIIKDAKKMAPQGVLGVRTGED